jgi:succinate dehydrogenase / fumarate reductase cytochrome b subunit
MESKEGIIGWFRFKGKGIGYFAYTFQRLSGLVIVFYLFLHFYVLSNLLKGATDYNSAIESIKYGPLDIFLVFDVLLALVIFYHGANGIRLALNEMGIGLKHNKLFFYVFESVSVVLLIVFLYYAWAFIAFG